MKIYTEIKGNVNDPQWAERMAETEVEYIDLDQWTAQKSRFVVEGERGNRYAVALQRRAQLADGDIIEYLPEQRRMAAVRIRLSDVMVADLSSLEGEPSRTLIRIALELGHAIGNQHWPAVVKGTKVFVPLTVDKKVMMSVMETHDIPHIYYNFHEASEVIPYMAPQEIRRLFGGASHQSHSHVH